jgi:hypothetical protein
VNVRAVAATAALLLLTVPAADAQSLTGRLANLSFPEVEVTVAPEVIFVRARDATLRDQSALELRRCIDNANCPDSVLRSFSNGNGDGRVEAHEVSYFETQVVFGLNSLIAFNSEGEFGTFIAALRSLVTVDGKAANVVRLQELRFADATGTLSNNPVRVTIQARLEFPVSSGDRHTIQIARASIDLQLAQRIVVTPAKGWRIDGGSIQPVGLQGYYGDGRIAGSQQELQGNEPMTFTLSRSGASLWTWVLSGAAILALAGLAVFIIARRRKG